MKTLDLTRRRFLGAAVGLATPFCLLSFKDLRAAKETREIFPWSVASGDPTPFGAMLWTRLEPSLWRQDEPVFFELSETGDFSRPMAQGRIEGRDAGPRTDYTVKADTDGLLAPNRSYFYRFLYRGAASPTGKCHTLPAPREPLGRLVLGVVTCQDYSAGYYGAFWHLAQEPEVRFVLHLGDAIYETAYSPRVYPQRKIELPSGSSIAMGLEDYRSLWRTYRSDPNFQRALEEKTFIFIWDDHETANDLYWDAALDCPAVPDHPYATEPQYASRRPELLSRLRLDAMRAWSEYIPARIEPKEGAAHPHKYFSIYRDFLFGDLAHLVLTDERSYRLPHPCGEKKSQRFAAMGCDARFDPSRTMLGAEQKAWFLDKMLAPSSLWKLWGNEVCLSPLSFGQMPITLDSWDGFASERKEILLALARSGQKNLIVLTGDLHAYLVGELSLEALPGFFMAKEENRIGVEYMTPSVTSSNYLGDSLLALHSPLTLDALQRGALAATNPHIRYFNASRFGYSTLELTRAFARYRAYCVDKTKSSDAAKNLLTDWITPAGSQRAFAVGEGLSAKPPAEVLDTL